MSRLRNYQPPIININTGYGGMKQSRPRLKEKLKPKFTLKYKQGKEKEKFEQTKFKLMNKKAKIKHIKNLINLSNDGSCAVSNNSRNLDSSNNLHRCNMNSDLDFEQSMLDVGENTRTFKMKYLDLSKLHNTIE